ncbi:pro-resilin [Cephus cinctus]|uniref:Pro-resilin n=1 Tax=Cephus cinctus TaxID=211228 RepID=A0AAJ7CDL0_CEPCN|nr:pro-resilin [Cephus cinctus]
MNRLQLLGLTLVLSCLDGGVLAGLLPGGTAGNGYQYNRPTGNGFTGGFGSPGNNAFPVTSSGGFGTPGSGGAFSQRPTGAYGAPGFGSAGSFGGTGGGTGAFTRPSSTYGSPGYTGNQGGNGGFQGSGGYQGGTNGYQGGYNGDDGRPQPYSFQYEVRDPPSGNDYSQQESSDGNTVTGEYRVLLPDSRTQIVRYTADNVNGYNADVQYEGQAQYPQGNIGGGFPGGFGAGGYQTGGVGGGGGNFGTGSGNFGGSNQYLPPGGYGK